MAMKIWIAGGPAGPRENYVATWLDEHLAAAGHETYCSSWDPIGGGGGGRARWVEVLRSSNADLLVQADELRGGLACRKDPIRAAAVNVGGTALLAQAAAEAGVPFAYLSSYEAVEGKDLFGLTKLAGEQAARGAGTDQRPVAQVIRLANVYGPGVRGLDAPMPNRFLEWAFKGESLTAHDKVVRSWSYVSDAVRAVRLILEDGRPGIWSVGSYPDRGAEISMYELARRCQAIAETSDIEFDDLVGEAHWPPFVPLNRIVDTGAVRALGWEPKVTLEDGLRNTAAWLRGV